MELSDFRTGTNDEDQGPLHDSMMPPAIRLLISSFTCSFQAEYSLYGANLMEGTVPVSI